MDERDHPGGEQGSPIFTTAMAPQQIRPSDMSAPLAPGTLGDSGVQKGSLEPETLGDMLLARAAAEPDRIGFTFLTYRSGEDPDATDLTYDALLTRAKAIAAKLQAVAAAGDRVLILCGPGSDYVAGFFGCQLAGMVAVPAYPPRNAKRIGRLEAIVADAGAAALLTTSDLMAKLARWGEGRHVLPEAIAVDRVSESASLEWHCPSVSTDDLAFLQYTSGTTGTPRGVMVSHG